MSATLEAADLAVDRQMMHARGLPCVYPYGRLIVAAQRHRPEFREADDLPLLTIDNVIYSAHRCRDCGAILRRAHPGPAKRLPKPAAPVSKTTHMARQLDRSIAKKVRTGTKAYNVLSLMRALRFGDPIDLPSYPRFRT